MKIKAVILSFILILISAGTFGCSEKQTAPVTGPFVYYLNSSITSLVADKYTGVDDPGMYDYLTALSTPTATEGVVPPLENITVLSARLSDGRVIVEFGRDYSNVSGTRELLVRAAVVKTLCQIEGVDEVEINVSGVPITNTAGEPIGTMHAYDFVDYFGTEQDDIFSEDFLVYYATGDGAGLIREVHRGYYESSMSREQTALKYMQENPETDGARPAIPATTNIINITTTDGICYLDMDMSFYDPEGNIPYNVALAAVVNTLCELPEVHSVQVSIIEPAESVATELSETISGMYERDMSLVIN